MKNIILVLMLICCVSGARLWAQGAPQLINYQGQLLATNGSPLATGDYSLTFRIYDAAESGNLVWGPQVLDGAGGGGHGPKVPVVDGYFNVMLGAVDTVGRTLGNAFDAATRYLEITVGTNNPIRPRQQILSAPYALQAAHVLAGGVNTDALADGAVTSVNLAPDIGVWNKSGSNISYNAGSVGIGTSIPAAKLHVAGGDILAGPVGEEWIFQFGADLLHITDRDAGAPQFQRGLALSQEGNVGIGLFPPTSRLDIAGAQDALRITANNPLLTMRDSGSGNARSQIASVGGSFNFFTESYLSGANSTAFLRLDNNGNVGIGAPAPNAKLEVRGNIRLGSSGEFFAPAALGNVRILHGVVSSAGGILAGVGFTVTRTAVGSYTVTFISSFTAMPTVTVSPQAGIPRLATSTNVGAGTAQVRTFDIAGALVDAQFHFIAIGPR